MIMGKLLFLFVAALGLIILMVLPTEGKRRKKVEQDKPVDDKWTGRLVRKCDGMFNDTEGMAIYEAYRCHIWFVCEWIEERGGLWWKEYSCKEGAEYVVNNGERVCKKVQADGCPPFERLYKRCVCPGRKKPVKSQARNNKNHAWRN